MKIKLFSSKSIKTSNVKSYVSVRVERYSFDIYDIYREVQWKYLDETNPNKRSEIRNTCVHGNKKRGLGMC